MFVYLPTPLAFVSKLPKPLFLLLSPIKVVAGATALFWALVYRLDSTPEFLFIQVSALRLQGRSRMLIGADPPEPAFNSHSAHRQARDAAPT